MWFCFVLWKYREPLFSQDFGAVWVFKVFISLNYSMRSGNFVFSNKLLTIFSFYVETAIATMLGALDSIDMSQSLTREGKQRLNSLRGKNILNGRTNRIWSVRLWRQNRKKIKKTASSLLQYLLGVAVQNWTKSIFFPSLANFWLVCIIITFSSEQVCELTKDMKF